jgi:hypothetical protein
MAVRFNKTGKGEVAILPRKEYEALVAKAAEADEDVGTARLVARARKEIAEGGAVIPLDVVNRPRARSTARSAGLKHAARSTTHD